MKNTNRPLIECESDSDDHETAMLKHEKRLEREEEDKRLKGEKEKEERKKRENENRIRKIYSMLDESENDDDDYEMAMLKHERRMEREEQEKKLKEINRMLDECKEDDSDDYESAMMKHERRLELEKEKERSSLFVFSCSEANMKPNTHVEVREKMEMSEKDSSKKTVRRKSLEIGKSSVVGKEKMEFWENVKSMALDKKEEIERLLLECEEDSSDDYECAMLKHERRLELEKKRSALTVSSSSSGNKHRKIQVEERETMVMREKDSSNNSRNVTPLTAFLNRPSGGGEASSAYKGSMFPENLVKDEKFWEDLKSMKVSGKEIDEIFKKLLSESKTQVKKNKEMKVIQLSSDDEDEEENRTK